MTRDSDLWPQVYFDCEFKLSLKPQERKEIHVLCAK